jgi:uncharacterized protein (TIGR02246 family)
MAAADAAELRADTPAQVIALFASCLHAGDLEAALTLYEPEAVLVAQPGEQVSGLEAIRAALAPFFAIGGQMTSDVRKVVEGAGLATVLNRWTLEGAQPDGTPLRLGATSADVVRRQPDGRWLLVIDDPWGAC